MAKKLTYKRYKELIEEQGQALAAAMTLAAAGKLDVTLDIPDGVEPMTSLAAGFSSLLDSLKTLTDAQEQSQAKIQELEQRLAEQADTWEKAQTELQKGPRRSVYEGNRSLSDTDETAVTATFDELWLPAITEAIQTRQTVYDLFEEDKAALALPVSYGDEMIGVLGFSAEDRQGWSAEEITAVEAVVEQLGLALENQRLFDQAQQRASELSVLNEMVGELTGMLDIEPILESIHRYTSRLMNTTNFYIALHNLQTNEVSFPIVIENNQQNLWQSRPYGNGLTEYILSSGKPVLIENGVDKWLQDQGVDSIGNPSQSWLGVPLRLGDRVVGVIALQSTQSYVYSVGQLDLLVAVANQAAIAMQNARLFQQQQARAQREQLLREIAAKVRSSADVDTIMRTAVQEIGQALGRRAFVQLSSKTDDTMKKDV